MNFKLFGDEYLFKWGTWTYIYLNTWATVFGPNHSPTFLSSESPINAIWWIENGLFRLSSNLLTIFKYVGSRVVEVQNQSLPKWRSIKDCPKTICPHRNICNRYSHLMYAILKINFVHLRNPSLCQMLVEIDFQLEQNLVYMYTKVWIEHLFVSFPILKHHK